MGALEFIDANGGRVTIHLEPYLADRATRIAALWKQMDNEDAARAEEVEVIMPGIKRGNEAPMSAVGDAAFVAAARAMAAPSLNDIVEQTAIDMAFSVRAQNDKSRDKEDFWSHTCAETKDGYIKLARDLFVIRPDFVAEAMGRVGEAW